MNKSQLKSYAPQARKDFIAAVTARANLLGLSEQGGQLEVAPAQTQGDVTLIAGQAWPAKLMGQRDKLIARIRKEGFAQTLEAVAYTWFNRFAALRYMELHDYLGHGYRALSSREAGGLPEILAQATDLVQGGAAAALPGLQPALVTELKLAGNRDGELYRLLLVAQCNALSNAMPFLFERIDDETELLLPDNLLRTDSVIADLVNSIEEQDWQEVEIIGWLYQFYISEKKDQVIGKVVKSEDIPAATQLFTPNWIVQYLVQNSVGRLWLMANPQSSLASDWPYYITPAEQTPEVQAQLDALIQTRVREDGDALNPESITVLDPACGSGHILVVAYDVLKAIYLERGYQPKSIPRLILEKNLYGLDIDDRAAQLAAFAILMKARVDDRRLFDEPLKLNVLALKESKGLNSDEIALHLAPFGLHVASLKQLLDSFKSAKTFGSLIQIPPGLNARLETLQTVLESAHDSGDLYARQAAEDALPLLEQARVLGQTFDVIVANPPYLGNKGMNGLVKEFVLHEFPDSRGDLYSVFLERGLIFLKAFGHMSMVTLQNWMFVPGFEALRSKILDAHTIVSLNHIGYNSFPELNSKIVRASAFCILGKGIANYSARFVGLDTKDQSADKRKIFVQHIGEKTFFDRSASFFSEVPGRALAYWLSRSAVSAFVKGTPLGEISRPVVGLQTGDNERFIRRWSEVSWVNIDTKRVAVAQVNSDARWVPYVKGGEYRKWFGNEEFVLDWRNDGEAIVRHRSARPQNRGYYFRSGLSYTNITSGSFGVRFTGPGFVFDQKGSMFFSNDHEESLVTAALLNGVVAEVYLRFLCSTLDFNPGDLSKIPRLVFGDSRAIILGNASELISISKLDWDSQEVSWNFEKLPLVQSDISNALQSSWESWKLNCKKRLMRAKDLEEENNRYILDAYGFDTEVGFEVSLDQVTLARADREKDCQRLISYAIGCMMGRYSLDEPGLIYAHSGNVGFEPGRYATFPADADGIVPITYELWFADDGCTRIREFLRAVWGTDTLEENMAWLAESLGTKASETPEETIRRYLADKFFKDHLQTYKKRPIYWLFSSGKQGAFQALVYLHRYNEGTLARLRAEYVVPLTGKLQARIEMLSKDAQMASSTAARNKLNKEVEKLNKKHVELLAFDERLRHYADMRISLNLDDGVKVNYGKFGDLLAEVKAVTGGAGDD
jgi:hypothetical protein